MLRQPNRSLCRRWIGVVLLLIFGGMAVYLAGNLFCPREPEEDAIPNDVFAVQGREDDGTVEAIMLKIVCLTFDDGPSSNTGPILDILQEKDVPATFFVTAQEVNQDYLPELERVVEEGHQVALHSASHRYSEIYADTESFWLDIKALCGGHPLAALSGGQHQHHQPQIWRQRYHEAPGRPVRGKRI